MSGAPRLPYVELDEQRARGDPRAARASRPAASQRGRERDTPGPAARRPGRDRQEHDGRRVRGPDRRGRHRAALPDRRDAGDRPGTCRTSPTCASGPRTSRRSSSPTATRITSARCRGCCASSAQRRDPARLRRPADHRDGPLQARRTQAAGRASCEDRPRRPDRRWVRSTSSSIHMTHSIPDSCAVALTTDLGHGAGDRRLQVRPDAGRRRAGRHAAAGGAGREGCCCSAAIRPTPTAPASPRPSGSSVRTWRRCSPGPRVGSS